MLSTSQVSAGSCFGKHVCCYRNVEGWGRAGLVDEEGCEIGPKLDDVCAYVGLMLLVC
jgi:hypothetical protein